MPPTAPVPAPGRYDARRATRLDYGRRLGAEGWQALSWDERRFLDALYWGDATAWPCPGTLVQHDHRETDGGEVEVDVPTLGNVHTATRIAPLVRTIPDLEGRAPQRFRAFLGFWRWWIGEARPLLQKDGAVGVGDGDLSGAPLIRAVPRRRTPDRAGHRRPRVARVVDAVREALFGEAVFLELDEEEPDAPARPR